MAAGNSVVDFPRISGTGDARLFLDGPGLLRLSGGDCDRHDADFPDRVVWLCMSRKSERTHRRDHRGVCLRHMVGVCIFRSKNFLGGAGRTHSSPGSVSRRVGREGGVEKEIISSRDLLRAGGFLAHPAGAGSEPGCIVFLPLGLAKKNSHRRCGIASTRLDFWIGRRLHVVAPVPILLHVFLHESDPASQRRIWCGSGVLVPAKTGPAPWTVAASRGHRRQAIAIFGLDGSYDPDVPVFDQSQRGAVPVSHDADGDHWQHWELWNVQTCSVRSGKSSHAATGDGIGNDVVRLRRPWCWE